MTEGPDNTTGKWQQFKTKFLSLTFRTQIILAIGVVALIAVIVVTATIVIDVDNPFNRVEDVTIRFVPVDRERVPGQTLSVDMVIDTKGEAVSAVQAVFDIVNKDGEPSPRLDLSCVDTDDCPDIIVGPAWGTIAELSRVGDTVTIAVGTNSPVSGDGVLVATINFSIPATAPYGPVWADFDPDLAAIIADDGQGTNIIDTVQSEDWEIVETLTNGSIQIEYGGPFSSVDPCGPPYTPPDTSSEVTISWTTNEPGDSNIKWRDASCPTCAWRNYDNGSGGVMNQPDPKEYHEFLITDLPGDTLYYYKAMSTSELTGDWIISDERHFFTGCGVPVFDDLEISNLSVTPSARLALVTWNTNLLADSRVFNLVPVNNRGDDTFFDPTVTLSHSLTIPSLEPSTDYCIDVSSTTSPPDDETANDDICFKTESEDLSLDANIVLKVERDRICDQWLSCASSVEVEDILGERRDLCFDYALCEELDVENNGECTKMISAFTQGGGSALEFTLEAGSPTSSSIGLAKNLTGYSKVGAKWQGRCSANSDDAGELCTSDSGCYNTDDPPHPETCDSDFPAVGVVSGSYPVSQMSQLGSSAGVPNGDFEAGFTYPWQPWRNDVEKQSVVQTVTDRTVLAADFNQVLSIRPSDKVFTGYSGAMIPLGNSLRYGEVGEVPVEYYVSLDVRTSDERYTNLRVELGFECFIPPNSNMYNYLRTTVEARADIPLSTGWQRVLAGPLEMGWDDRPKESGQETCLSLLVDPINPTGEYRPFYVDNIQIQPVLKVKPGGADVSPESHVSRSCRQYPSDDAPSCRYFDINSGRELQGWEGYCLQTDPRNERRCLQWVPIDLIAGSSPALAAYGQAGYGTSPEDRVPLYYCTQSRGNAPYGWNISTGTGTGSHNGGNPDQFLYNGDLYYGWDLESGLIDFKNITYNSRGLTPDASNPNPLYIYDIEQILVNVTQREEGAYPLGTYYFNRDNGFEKIWVWRCDKCPVQQSEFKDPNSWWHWQSIVDDADKCVDISEGNLANLIGIKFVFDEDTGVFKGIEAGLCDDSTEHGWVKSTITFYLREWCTQVAQVVDIFGNNTAWAERIHSNLYSVPELGYQRSRDLVPFGGMVVPEPDYDPTNWDYSSKEPGRQPIMIESADTQNFPQSPHQARASSPYGGGASPCVSGGDVGQAMCVSGEKAKMGESCVSNADCGYGADGKSGRCTGVVPPAQVDEGDFFDELECPTNNPYGAATLFARSEQVWKWDYVSRQYKIDTNLDSNWDVAKDKTIAKPPRIENLVIKGGSGHEVDPITSDIIFADNKFGKISITFNSVVDPEQVPLVRYTVDWGDGFASEESNMKIAPQSSLPHVLTHTYSCVRGESCDYTPRIQIEDNWSWCSGDRNSAGGLITQGIENYTGDGTSCDSWNWAPLGSENPIKVRLSS